MVGPARHQRASLVLAPGGRPGYVLDGVPYGLPRSRDVAALAARHAGALGFLEWHDVADPADRAVQEGRAVRAALVARALTDLAAGGEPDAAGLAALRADLPGVGVVRVRTDGSADKTDGHLSLGYLLGDRPYALNLPGAAGHEGLAEREAIRVALTHARALARLDGGLPLSRAQGVALRRVHFALKAGGSVLY